MNMKQIIKESREDERKICYNIASIIRQHFSTRQAKIKYGENVATFIVDIVDGKPSISKRTAPYTIFHAGANDSSDIYVLTPSDQIIGIEVKETVSSKLFNPQLSYTTDRNFTVNPNAVTFVNAQRSEQIRNSILQSLVPDKYRKVIASEATEVLKALSNLGNYTTNQFPLRIRSLGVNSQAEVLDIMHDSGIVPQGSNSVKLCSYTIYDNKAVKDYFMGDYSGSYKAVQYIQFGDGLYLLNPDDSDLFIGNGTLKVVDYDSIFTGINVAWYIDFSNKQSDNYIRIRGRVTSTVKKPTTPSLTDIGDFPDINVTYSDDIVLLEQLDRLDHLER